MAMNPTELRATAIIGTVLATRLLGIFLILPVFSSYALGYTGASHFLAGLAFGIYALTQAAFQIPFGKASDRFGRKPVVIAGLVLFCAGSIACGLSENIWQLTAARALQGSGAVGSAAIAALGDFTRPEVRGQSFAATGIIIGAGFMLSFLAGPYAASLFGFANLFYILAALGVVSIAITALFFPSGKRQRATEENKTFSLRCGFIRKILINSFIISSVLHIFLFVFPLRWESLTGKDISLIWKTYLKVLIPAAVLSYPFIRIMEKQNKMYVPPKAAAALLVAGTAIAAASAGETGLIIAGAAFFLGHSIFQALLPAFLTRAVPDSSRGNMSGFLSLSGFLGTFLGSLLAGMFYSTGAALAVCLGLVAVWMFAGIPVPPEMETKQ